MFCFHLLLPELTTSELFPHCDGQGYRLEEHGYLHLGLYSAVDCLCFGACLDHVIRDRYCYEDRSLTRLFLVHSKDILRLLSSAYSVSVRRALLG